MKCRKRNMQRLSQGICCTRWKGHTDTNLNTLQKVTATAMKKPGKLNPPGINEKTPVLPGASHQGKEASMNSYKEPYKDKTFANSL